jgi:hypothetical protein
LNLIDEIAYFEEHIGKVNPFFYPERVSNFLKGLLNSLDENKLIVCCKANSVWFRAQKLCDGCLEYDDARMSAPPPEKTIDQRASPKGVPV